MELVAIAEIRREMLRVAQELLAFCFDENFIVHIVYLFYLGNQWNVHRVFGFNSICMEILLYILVVIRNTGYLWEEVICGDN